MKEMQNIGIASSSSVNLDLEDESNDNAEKLKMLGEAIRKVSNAKDVKLGEAVREVSNAKEKFGEAIRKVSNAKDVKTEEEYKEFQEMIMRKITDNDVYIRGISKKSCADFNILKIIGEGGFGKVYLAQSTEDGLSDQLFAIKVLNKEEIIRGDDLSVVMSERKVLELGSKDNFIAGLHSTFQTRSHLFFVLEFMPAGDLLREGFKNQKGNFQFLTS